jgi:hypothetical protein
MLLMRVPYTYKDPLPLLFLRNAEPGSHANRKHLHFMRQLMLHCFGFVVYGCLTPTPKQTMLQHSTTLTYISLLPQ